MSGTQKQYDVRTIANWILDRAQSSDTPITNMAINKIVYFLYESLFVEDGRVIFSAKIEAWDHGPVLRELYSEFKKFGNAPITGRANRFSVARRKFEVAVDEIDAADREKFGAIVDHYLPLSAARLRQISHQPDGPWFTVWTHAGGSNAGMEITPEVIASSFNGFKVTS